MRRLAPTHILFALVVAAVAGAVGFLFYHNGHRVELNLGSQSSLQIPAAALVLGCFAAGAAALSILGMLRGSAVAVRRWRRARVIDRDADLQRMTSQGEDQLWAHEFESATRVLAKVVEQRSSELRAGVALSDAYVERGELESARTLLEGLRAKLGVAPQVLARLAELALRRGNTGAAADLLREASVARPNSPRILASLAGALESHGQYEEAARTLERWVATERDPIRRERAAARLRALQYRSALSQETSEGRVTALRRIVSESADFVPAVVALGRELASSRDDRGAERVLRSSLARRPTGAVLGQLEAVLGRGAGGDRAVAVLRDAARGHRLAGPRLAYARALIAQGKLDLATASLDELSSLPGGSGAAGVDAPAFAPERDLVGAELAQARGNDAEAARLFARAATGTHLPFSYGCRACGRQSQAWSDRCGCGDSGTLDWLINLDCVPWTVPSSVPPSAHASAADRAPVTSVRAALPNLASAPEQMRM